MTAARHGVAAAVLLVAVLVLQPLFVAPEQLPLNPDWLGAMRLALLDRASLLDHGQLPMQVPAEAGGMVLLGHPHDLAAGPWLVLVLLLGPVLGTKALAALLVALGGLGTARFAQVGLRLGPAASALAGGLLVAGAALPAELRSGSLPKLQLALLPWILVGWHTPGGRGLLLMGAATALMLGHAGLTGVVGLVVVLAWGLFTGSKERWRSAAAAVPLVGLLLLGKLAAVAVLLEGGGVASTKGAGGLGGWLEQVQGMAPGTLLQSLAWPPLEAARPTWPAEPGLVHLGLAGLLLPVGLWGLRQRWRLGVWTGGIVAGAVVPALWLPLVALVPPLQGIEKVDKAMVVPVALVLSLVAGVGLELVVRRGGRRAAGVGLLLLVPAVLSSRELVADQFPVVQLPAVGAELPPGAVVALPVDPAVPWHDGAALWRLALAEQGVAAVGPTTFSRAGQPTATHRLVLPGPLDWRRLAAGLGEGRPLPEAKVLAVPGALPAARQLDGRVVQLQESPARIVLDAAEPGQQVRIARPFDPRWQGEGARVEHHEDQLLVTIPDGETRVVLTHRAPGVAAAWMVSMAGWLGVLAGLLWTGWRRDRTGLSGGGPAIR